MKIFLTFLIFSAQLSFASALCDQVFNEMAIHQIPEEARVVHVPQIHYTGTELNYPPEYAQFYRENIIRSQLLLARTMMTYTDGIYVSEAITDHLEAIHRDKMKIAYSDSRSVVDQKTVQNGMDPYFYKKTYDELTNKEKELLYEQGAAISLFLLGHIDHIYPSVKDSERLERILEKIMKITEKMESMNRHMNEYKDYLKEDYLTEVRKKFEQLYFKKYSLIFQERESLLKEQVEELFTLYPQKKIFFIYGINHDSAYLFNKKYFYRLPNYLTVSKKFLDHPDWGLDLLRTTSERFMYLNREGMLSEEDMRRMIENYQESYNVLSNYIHNSEDDMKLFSIQKDRYLTNQELLKEAKNAVKYKGYLKNQLNSL